MNRPFALVFTALALAVAPIGAPAGAQVGKPLGMLDPNIATEQELAALPHLNVALAKALIAKRPFANMLAVDSTLASLTREQRTELYRRLFLHINLNATTREEILLIPGSGNRVVREFQEYAPYASLAVFHREMRKYWDEAEVARLESYVFVPLDPNTASDEDILTIPGVGARMLREFKEYRPWRTVEQFRREIGKYVDANEVSRLLRYVRIGG
jgi:DNA uptake protein ComE-like DNA-binding protein